VGGEGEGGVRKELSVDEGVVEGEGWRLDGSRLQEMIFERTHMQREREKRMAKEVRLLGLRATNRGEAVVVMEDS